MSSTKRGGQRGDHDNYPTPAWCTHRLLDRCPELRQGGHWLEPAAGNGQIITAIESYVPPEGLQMESPKWTAIELRKGEQKTLQTLHDADIVNNLACPQDYFTYKTEAKFDTIITNPPFRLAMEFIRKSLTLNTSRVIMLLRLNFVGTAKRHKFFTERMANRILVIPDRPSFTGEGHDSIEYAWFWWELQNHAKGVACMEMLNLTPKEERRLK